MNIFIGKYLINIAILIGCAIFFVSCDESLAKVDNKKNTNFASQIIYKADIVQRDSGFVNLRFKAPIIEKYELVDSPYVEAKKGIYLEYYDKKNPKVPGKIWANYAKLNELNEFYTAKGDVKIRTNDGKLFATQSIFWDKRKQKMFTQDTVYVTDTDGSILVGSNGMEAKDDFSEYKFYNNAGSFPSQQIPAAGK